MQKRRLSVILAAMLLFSLVIGVGAPAFAEETGTETAENTEQAEAAGGQENTICVLDAAELDELLQQFISKNHLSKNNISIGFCYTETGESWYYNETKDYYSASLFKVPLMMCITEKIRNGELDWNYLIGNERLETIAEFVLVRSNNAYAFLLMDHFWSSKQAARELWPALAGMEQEELKPSFYRSSYFNALFMTRVFETLYANADYYYEVIDYLKLAQPGEYFRTYIGDQYEIAQKYGSYESFKHTCGIIYTEHPIIISILTKNTWDESRLAGSLAQLLVEYTENVLDVRLAEQEPAPQETVLQEAETEQPAVEEVTAEVQETAQVQNGNPDSVAAPGETAKPVQPAVLLLCGGGAILLLVHVAAAVKSKKSKRAKGKHLRR